MSHKTDINIFIFYAHNHSFVISYPPVRRQPMENYLDTIKSEFTLSKLKLQELTEEFQKQLEIGLKCTDGMLKALPTFVYDLPKGNEIGKFLTVDLGGTNLRIGLVELLGNGKFSIKKDSSIVPNDLKCGSGRAIFDFIAGNIEKFLEHPEIEAELPLKLGFTFSFPIEQNSLSHGKILGWSKEIDAKDVIGSDAVSLLQAALHSRGLDIAVEALVNDTVGTLLAQIYRDDRTKMSVILGTGSNAAYVEKSDQVIKTKINSDSTVINIEWGSFGDGTGANILPITRFDFQLDNESKNRGLQKYEKMISGMYLGEIFRLIISELVELGILAWNDEINPTTATTTTTPYSIKTKHMSQFHEAFISNNKTLCNNLIKHKFGLNPLCDSDLKTLSKIAEMISLRSCYLCAIGIVAVHRHLLKNALLRSDEMFSVALDGALYQRYPNYSKILQNLVCELDGVGVEVCRVVLVMAEDLSSVGAAAAIAAAKKIKLK